MGDGAEAGGEPGAGLFGMIVEGAHAAAIGDVTGLIDDVDALGPGGVGGVGSVAYVIDADWNGVVKTFDEIVGDGHPLFEVFWLGVADVFP